MIRAFSGGPENKRIVSPRTYVPPPSILTLLVLLALGWGVNWPIMKTVMTEMPPRHFRVLCLAVGAAGLFAIARANRLPIRVPSGAWPRLIAITLFNVAAWNVLAVYGVTFMESGRAAILAYTFPVRGVLLGVWVLREPVTGSRLAGVVLGVLGMLVLLGDEIHAVGRSPAGALLLIASAISWAVSTAIMKRWPVDLPTTSFTGWQMLLALAPILSGAVLFEEGSFSPLALSTWPFWGLVYNAHVRSGAIWPRSSWSSPPWRSCSCRSAGHSLARSARFALPDAASSRDSFGTPVRQRPVPDLSNSPCRELRRRFLTKKAQGLPKSNRGLRDGQRGGARL